MAVVLSGLLAYKTAWQEGLPGARQGGTSALEAPPLASAGFRRDGRRRAAASGGAERPRFLPWSHAHAGLALVCSSHAVMAQGLATLAKRAPAAYARHRELLIAAALLSLTWMVLMLGERAQRAGAQPVALLQLQRAAACRAILWLQGLIAQRARPPPPPPTHPLAAAWYGGTVIISFHEGGTLRLLALMTLATSAIWICQYTLYSRMVLCRAALVLPLVAAVRLASGRSVCRRQLSTLGAAGVAPPPLAALHSGLGWAQ